MQYKITDYLPEGFQWSVYIYQWDDLFLDVKIKVPLSEQKKISSFIFLHLKQEFTTSKSKSVKQARENEAISNFVQHLDEVFSDEEIETVLSGFEAFDISKKYS